MNDEIFIGIDVCKAWLDVAQVPALAAGEASAFALRVDNEDGARAVLVEQLKRLRGAGSHWRL